jgi:hypothetical protein
MPLPKKDNPRRYTITTKVAKPFYEVMKDMSDKTGINMSKLAAQFLMVGYMESLLDALNNDD